jgi:hypothetical protein
MLLLPLVSPKLFVPSTPRHLLPLPLSAYHNGGVLPLFFSHITSPNFTLSPPPFLQTK